MEINMGVGVNYAGFWRRFVGSFVDNLILTVVLQLVNASLLSILPISIPNELTFSALLVASWPIISLFAIIDLAIILLYYSFFESSNLQATLGKYVIGIKVTSVSGSRISFKKAFLRRVYTVLSILPIFIGYIAAAFTSRKQTFHDMLAKTVVVVNKPRKPFILVGIVIITLILGVASNKLLGTEFGLVFKTSNEEAKGFDSANTKKGNEVDSVLQNEIIAGLYEKKVVFESEDPSMMRSYLLQISAYDQKLVDQINNFSDEDLLKISNLVNGVTQYMTDKSLRSADTIWTFNEDMTIVRIRTKTVLGGKEGTGYIDMHKVNDSWY